MIANLKWLYWIAEFWETLNPSNHMVEVKLLMSHSLHSHRTVKVFRPWGFSSVRAGGSHFLLPEDLRPRIELSCIVGNALHLSYSEATHSWRQPIKTVSNNRCLKIFSILTIKETSYLAIELKQDLYHNIHPLTLVLPPKKSRSQLSSYSDLHTKDCCLFFF